MINALVKNEGERGTRSKIRVKQCLISLIFNVFMYLLVCVLVDYAAYFSNFSLPPSGKIKARWISREHAHGMKINILVIT